MVKVLVLDGGAGKPRTTEEVALMRRIILVLAVAAVMAAMMIASAMPAFAEEENSCGKAGDLRTGPQSNFKDCGIKNNPDYKNNKFPPGEGL